MAYRRTNNSNSVFKFKRFPNHRSGNGRSEGTSPKAEITSQRGFNHEPIESTGNHIELQGAEFSGEFRHSQRNTHSERRDIFGHSFLIPKFPNHHGPTPTKIPNLGAHPRGVQPIQGSRLAWVPRRHDLFKQPQSSGCSYQNVELWSSFISDTIFGVTNARRPQIPRELHDGNEDEDQEEERNVGVGAPKSRNQVFERECGFVLLGGYEASFKISKFPTGNGVLEEDFV